MDTEGSTEFQSDSRRVDNSMKKGPIKRGGKLSEPFGQGCRRGFCMEMVSESESWLWWSGSGMWKCSMSLFPCAAGAVKMLLN